MCFCHFDEGEITLVAHIMRFLLRRNDKIVSDFYIKPYFSITIQDKLN